jgi:hypothetical protein
VGHGFVFDLQFNHDQWQSWASVSGLLATVMVLPMIDLSQSWVVGVWLTLFMVQVAEIGCARGRGPSITGVYFGSQGYCVRYKDGSVEACTLECPVMLPVGFLVRLKTVSARPYAAPVLKAVTDPSTYRRASVWLRFYPK